uniref:Glutamate/phenylalanine/leucine/valine/L-tryptophan dehydrogenase C-terminal domain-containing protein n=1 Tax=Branchiostoma floridae TaxID=7739 RepID=C3YAZ0_BRAFL|eukprot:XP_002606581.1 hypothetical protein BRAFLDRAFT_108176 [Branchiostoma floridae]
MCAWVQGPTQVSQLVGVTCSWTRCFFFSLHSTELQDEVRLSNSVQPTQTSHRIRMSTLRTVGGVLLSKVCGKHVNNAPISNKRLLQLFQVSSYFGAQNNVYLTSDAAKKETTDSLLAMDPNRFAGHLQKLGIRRCFVVWDFEEGKAKVSHPELEELAQFCAADKPSLQSVPDCRPGTVYRGLDFGILGVNCWGGGDSPMGGVLDQPASLAQVHSAGLAQVNYDQHEGVFMEVGRRTGVLMGAFVWRTYRGQACGGIRLWNYPVWRYPSVELPWYGPVPDLMHCCLPYSVEVSVCGTTLCGGIRLWNYPGMDRYLTDGLRLAQGMGVKSALAGLWAGGGKGVVQEPMHNKHRDPDFRQKMFYDYGDFLSSLNGCYVSAEDVGLNVNDLNNVMNRTRYTTCISEELGGSGNPSILTGKGVVCAMEAALDFLNMGTLKEKTVAIQGAGNVGKYPYDKTYKTVIIIETLLEKGVKYIYVTECHQNRVDDMKRVLADKANGRLEIQKVPIEDTSIMSYDCDILSPCALGGILNAETIPKISAPIVCGAANNQLGCPEDNQLLKERGITYIVDYVANRMGIVNCANETYGRLPDDPAITRHLGRDWENSVFKITKEILQKAEKEDITPVEAADVLADKASQQLHPIWPHRSQHIIKALILNAETIPKISAPIVCGAANNQLGCPEDNQLLKERGITYIVDYVANRMGIVNCANETYGRLPDDPAITRHLGRDWENSVFKITKEILQKAEKEDITPVEAADVLADKASQQLHPIWPHRSQHIIKALEAVCCKILVKVFVVVD